MTRHIRAAARQTFRSLRTRNYRLFFAGQLVSLIGTWMQWVAQGWLVLRLSDSGFAVGLTTGLQFAPTALLGAWAGLIADRFDKRRVLLATQAAAGVLALTLGVLTATGAAKLWIVYLLAFLLGCVTAVDHPTRQSFVIEMVGHRDVANAVALNSAAFNAARIVGPALAAALIATVGIEWSFFANALSYVAVVAGLRAMDPAALHRDAPLGRSRGQIRQALAYVWRSPHLRATLLAVSIVASFGLNFTVVLPLLARFTFNRGATVFGVLTSVMAAGSLVGALTVAWRARPSMRALALSAAVFGACTLLTAAAPTVTLAAVALVPTGAAGIAFMATANSTLQLESPAWMRGRVMALYALVFLGGTALGAPAIGWVSGQLGPRAGLAIGGVLSLAAASVVPGWRRAPEMAEGDDVVADATLPAAAG